MRPPRISPTPFFKSQLWICNFGMLVLWRRMCIFGIVNIDLPGVAMHGTHKGCLKAFLKHDTGGPTEALETRLALASGDGHLKKVVGGDQVIEEIP